MHRGAGWRMTGSAVTAMDVVFFVASASPKGGFRGGKGSRSHRRGPWRMTGSAGTAVDVVFDVASASKEGGVQRRGGSRLHRKRPWRISNFVFFSSVENHGLLGVVLGGFWVPFGLRFGLVFGTFSHHFLGAFFIDFGRHFGSVLAPFGRRKSTSGSPGYEKADLWKPLFY